MLSNPLYDPYQILTKVYSNGTHLKQAIADTPIEEQYRARSVKIVYGVMEKDAFLDFGIRVYAEKNPKLAIRILLKIAMYMLFYMDKKRYMVTDSAVELCEKLGKGGVKGFVNAFLRKVDLAEIEKKLPKGEEGESLEVSYPLFAWKLLKKEYGERAKEIASAKSGGVSVRFTKGKEKYLTLPHEETPFSEKYSAYLFPSFVREKGFFDGEYTFQSLGSIAIVDVVESHDCFLDACSAPGGKSVLLSPKCKRITAFELHEHRVKLIEEYVKRMGTKNVFPVQKDSSVYDETYFEKFDGILVDAPCSGFGTVSENPDVKLFRKEEDLLSIEKAQYAILDCCAKYLKKDGKLYYSTCSVFERENDGIVEKFLLSHPDFEVEETDSPLCHEKKKYGLQFLPDEAKGAGFYVCKLHRKV